MLLLGAPLISLTRGRLLGFSERNRNSLYGFRKGRKVVGIGHARREGLIVILVQ